MFGSYTDVQDKDLVAGSQFKVTQGANPVSLINGGAGVIAAGFGVVYGAVAGEAILPAGAGVFAGVVALPHTIEVRAAGSVGASLDAGGRYGYPVNYEMAVAQGDTWAVWVDGTVVQGNPVFLNHTVATSVIGAFRATANSANAQAVPNAVFVLGAVGTAANLAVAVIQFN